MLKCLVSDQINHILRGATFFSWHGLDHRPGGTGGPGTRIGIKEEHQLFIFTVIAIKYLLQNQEHKIRATDALEIILIWLYLFAGFETPSSDQNNNIQPSVLKRKKSGLI